MKKYLYLLFSTIALSAVSVAAKEDVPRGFEPLSEIEAVKAEALEKKRLVVLVVKGKDDDCPNCATALDNGMKAVGSGVVKVFARAETIGDADSAGFSPALKDRIKKRFIEGASVTFVVFDPEISTIVAEAGRKELQNDKDATAKFKKAVQLAKKELK